jgi:cation:H+ antiporter
MVINIIILLIGLFFLVKGSGLFVHSAARIAKKLKVSDFIIGVTLIALGTSLPELISSIIASMKKESLLVIGTIVGANIANLSYIVGLASLISPIKIEKSSFKREGYFLTFIIILLGIFLIDQKITRAEGGVFLLVFLAYNVFIFDSVKKLNKNYEFKDFTSYFFKFKFVSTLKHGIFIRFNHQRKKVSRNKLYLAKDLIFLALGSLLIYFGAKYVVNEAIFLADFLMASTFVIGVLISIGTTLPEMSVAISASRKNLGNITLGNSLGSSITNILLVLGISALIYPLTFTQTTIYYSLAILFCLNIVLLFFIKTDWKIKRVEGIILIISYFIFLIALLYGAF